MSKNKLSRGRKSLGNRPEYYISQITEDFQLQLMASSYTSFCLKFSPDKGQKKKLVR